MARFSVPTARDWIVELLVLAAAVATLLILARRYGASSPLVVLVFVAVLLVVLVKWHAATSAYRCPQCSTEFQIGAWRDFLSPNLVGEKYVRCPHCRQWAAMQVLTKAK